MNEIKEDIIFLLPNPLKSAETRFIKILGRPGCALVLMAGFMFGAQFLTLDLNSNRLAAVVEGNVLLRLVDFVGGGACSRGSIFAISVVFIILARFMMICATNIVPFYAALAREGFDGQRQLERRTTFLALVTALLCAGVLTQHLTNLGIILPNLEEFAKAGLSFFGGALVILAITKLIDHIMWNGLLAVMVAGFAMSWIRWFVWTGRQASHGLISWGSVFTVGTGLALAIVTSILLERYVIKVPVLYARHLTQRTRKQYGGTASHIPIKPISPFGNRRCFETMGLIMAAGLFDLLLILPGRYGGGFGRILVALVVPTLLFGLFSFVRAFINVGPDKWNELADNMKKYGGFLKGIPPGMQTVAHLRSRATGPVFLESIFLVVGLAAAQATNLFLPLYVNPLSFVSMWALVEYADDILLVISAHRALHTYYGFLKRPKR